MEKLMKTSKNLDFFFSVMQKIIIVAVAIVLIATAALTFLSGDTVGGGIIDIGGVQFDISDEFAPIKKDFLVYVWIMITLLILIVTVIYYMFSIIRKILQPMKEGCPFDKSVGYNIRKIANATIILGILANTISAVKTVGAILVFRFSELFAEGAVEKVTAHLSFDVTFFIVYFILLLISHVFIYGAELQKLSDETL